MDAQSLRHARHSCLLVLSDRRVDGEREREARCESGERSPRERHLGAELTRLGGGLQVSAELDGQALGIALFSYAGTISWGFGADWDAVPDLDGFREAIDAAFAELCDVTARVSAAAGSPRRAA